MDSNIQKIQNALKLFGLDCQIKIFPQSTRSSNEAAQAIGCTIEQIAKSIVFKSKKTQRPILVIASGSNRVNEKKVSEYIGEPIEKADADFVRQKTGFAIGGVPPIGHFEKVEIFIDEDLLQYKEIWAAAGASNAVFKLAPAELIRMTGGRVVSIK